MVYILWSFLLAGWLSLLKPQHHDLPEGFVRIQILENLNPVSMTVGPNGTLFLLEKHGEILMVQNDELIEEPFMKIQVQDNQERGLLGMAFHPNFLENHFFYLFYSVPVATSIE